MKSAIGVATGAADAEWGDEICKNDDATISTTSRGLASLIQKGFLFKEKDLYSIHYRLIPYMRLKADCDYGTAIREIKIK